MDSVFSENINETFKKSFHTKPLVESFRNNPGLFDSIARVCAVIETHFINNTQWENRIVDGSITYQHLLDNCKVIKVFYDPENKISTENSLPTNNRQIVIGIELTNEDLLTRKLIRDYLRSTFNDNYLDPALNFPKYCLLPQTDHLYDIVLLRNGVCPFDFNQAKFDEIRSRLDEIVGQHTYI